MINRIHFNAFGGVLYPGGAYNWMCFFVYKGTGLQLGNLVPRALFPGENRLGDEVARGRACNWATSFPKSSPTRPCEAERVSLPRPWDWGLRRRTSLHAVFDSWSVEKWLTFPARICLLEAFTCKKFGKLVSFVLSVIHKGYLSENVYLCFPYKDQNCNAKVKFLDLA